MKAYYSHLSRTILRNDQLSEIVPGFRQSQERRPMDKQHHIRVLLDGAGIFQVTQHRPAVG